MRAMRLLRRNESAARAPLPAPEPDGAERELAARQNDGLHIALLWHPLKDALFVSVADARTGRDFRFGVARQDALEAFHHPFAYAP